MEDCLLNSLNLCRRLQALPCFNASFGPAPSEGQVSGPGLRKINRNLEFGTGEWALL